MILTFRPIKVWPEGWKRYGQPYSPFSATYQATLNLLDKELEHLGVTEAILQVDADEGACRLDGQLRADAKVGYCGVILTLETKRHGTLVYPCDAFTAGHSKPAWRENLRAIALGLEALRKVERYGIANRGQQYAGYRELGSGIAMGTGRMTVDEAIAFLHDNAPGSEWDWDDPDAVAAAYKVAAKRLHPDVGGDPELFKRLQEAIEVLGG